MTDESWPYDASQNDPLTAMRIPVVGVSHPRWKYEVALCISPLYADPPVRPTDAEALMIASLIGYHRARYGKSMQAAMLMKPFDTDSGTNTIILLKRAEDSWAWRRRSFQGGDGWYFMPPPPQFASEGGCVMTLLEVLDAIHLYGQPVPCDRWQNWKANHPEVFPPAS